MNTLYNIDDSVTVALLMDTKDTTIQGEAI